MPQPILKQLYIQPLIRRVITTATAQLRIKFHSQLRQPRTAIDQTCQRMAFTLIHPPANLKTPRHLFLKILPFIVGLPHRFWFHLA